jgi:hypothetical protein
MKRPFQASMPACRFLWLSVAVLVFPGQGDFLRADPPEITPPARANMMDVCCADGSIVKMLLMEENIELDTDHGKLLIPVADIREIRVGVRTSAGECKRIDAAIAELGHNDPKRRDSAMAELLELKEKSYAALRRELKSNDKCAAERAELVLEKLQDMIGADNLEAAQVDRVSTAHSVFVGQLKADAFRVHTFLFGERTVKVGDLVSLRGRSD